MSFFGNRGTNSRKTPIISRSSIIYQQGQSFTEIAIILGLLVSTTIAALSAYGISVRDVYCTVIGGFGVEPQACQAHLLWEDGFDDLDRWNMTNGNGWALDDGQLCVTRGGEHQAFTGDEEWDDFTFQLDQANMTRGNGYGLYFRVSNEPAINGYAFQYDPGYNKSFIFRKIVNGHELWPPIAVSKAPPDFQWNNTAYQVSVQAKGDDFTAFINGEPVVSANDSSYSTGRVGLRIWGDTRVCFDDLSVTQ